ncbi:MAG: response regulator [Fibromonadales bacterium]|nr:response regulator [Fibromonadales bacterium]
MKTIFVVDDADTNLVMAKDALENDYRVLTMSSAVKMFNILNKVTPDLILLDIEMPEMNGFAALEKLKQNEQTAKIPVVFLTAHAKDHDSQLGAEDFITKPFSVPALQNCVAELIKQSHLEG